MFDIARKLIVFFLLMISLLGACSQQEEASLSKGPDITLNEIKTAITEQGVELEESDLPSENVFIQELNGVSPTSFFIDGKTLSIYIFPSEEAREKGMEDFEEKTATMELVIHKTYTNKNVLVFYVDGNEETNSKLNTAINELE